MWLLVVLGSLGTGVCLGLWLRGRIDQRDWRMWQRELDTPEPDGLEHYRRTF